MLSQGFIPYPGLDRDYIQLVEFYRDGYNNEEILFWLAISKPYSVLSANPFWSIVTRGYLQEQALKANAFPMLFFNLDMLYTSNRPRTDIQLRICEVSCRLCRHGNVSDV